MKNSQKIRVIESAMAQLQHAIDALKEPDLHSSSDIEYDVWAAQRTLNELLEKFGD